MSMKIKQDENGRGDKKLKKRNIKLKIRSKTAKKEKSMR